MSMPRESTCCADGGLHVRTFVLYSGCCVRSGLYGGGDMEGGTMLASLVDDLEAAFDKLTAAFADPSLLRFTDVRAEMERLERVANKKAFADVAFAHICERDGAGAAVGANYANTYLERALDISPGEAHSRLSRGRDLFGPEDKEDPGLDLGEPAPPRGRERARKNSRR